MNRAVTDVNFEDLIMSMLVFDKRHRKGLRGAVNLTDNDPYFKDVCWDDVYNRRLISNAIISDVSFDPSLHIEEILFEVCLFAIFLISTLLLDIDLVI
eukprot:Awhi_evm1s7155